MMLESASQSDPTAKPAHPTANADGWFGPFVGLAMLVVILALTAFGRWPYLSTPLERDEGEFAYGGQTLLAGELPYVAFYAMKLPGIYAAYAGVELIFGNGSRAIHLGLLLVNLVDIVLLYFLAARLFDRAVGLYAAAAFAMLAISPAAQGTQGQAEHFVLAPVLLGAILLDIARRRSSLAWLFASGVAFGIALVVKQHGGVFTLFALAVVAGLDFSAWRCAPVRKLAELGVLSLGCALPLGVIALFYAWRGAWDPFLFWTFTYASRYATAYALADAWNYFGIEMGRQTSYGTLLWGAAGVGLLLLGWARRYAGNRMFFLLFLAAGFLAILPGLSFFGHYFLLLYPALSMSAGLAVVTIARVFGRQGWWGMGVASLLIAVSVVWPAVQLVRYYGPLAPRELSRVMYVTNGFPEMEQVADYLKQHMEPGERLAVLGSEPELFVYTGRRSVTGHIYMYPLLEVHPFALEMQRQFIKDVEEARPKWLVFVNNPYSWMPKEGAPADVIDWIGNFLPRHYYCVARMDVFADRNSELIVDADQLRDRSASDVSISIYRRQAGE